MDTAIATDRLTKRYGSRAAVTDLSLRVPEGCVYGFLGPNGSGKSTTMKMLLSLIRPTTGEVHILGRA
ncbi:MAG: ATP-binding cassette domain-containing protein, partial [Brevibacterium sp.]|nr:ATP-binding cassette domain-containing protein [Brevibacterium sp.]